MNEQITTLLQSLADKLGTTVEHLWTVLINQASVVGWCYIVWCIAYILTCFGLVFGWIKWNKLCKVLRKESCIWPEWMVAFTISLAIVSFMALICLCYMFSNLSLALSCWFNPEFWALKEVLSVLN